MVTLGQVGLDIWKGIPCGKDGTFKKAGGRLDRHVPGNTQLPLGSDTCTDCS